MNLRRASAQICGVLNQTLRIKLAEGKHIIEHKKSIYLSVAAFCGLFLPARIFTGYERKTAG
jgi:hypothetical protein